MRIARPTRMRRRPRVTVVIPHFNYGRYLQTAVDSALDQQGVDVEIIIVDDKSTDGSTEVARRIAASDDRITLVEHAENMRHIRTYNDGLSRASGDYVVLLSADDALTRDSLTRSVALMEAHPDVGLVYGAAEIFSAEDTPDVRESGGWWQIWSGDEWIARLAGRGRNAVVNPEAVMRRSVYESTGGYNPDFPHAGDMYMWLQAAAVSDVGYVAGPRQAYYRDHGGNMHLNEYVGVLDDMEQVLGAYERFFAEDGARVRRAPSLAGRARRSVAREALLRGALLRAEGAPRSTLQQLQMFASRTAPEIVGSVAWRWAGLTATGGRAARVVRSTEALRWRIRSRRHLAVGL